MRHRRGLPVKIKARPDRGYVNNPKRCAKRCFNICWKKPHCHRHRPFECGDPFHILLLLLLLPPTPQLSDYSACAIWSLAAVLSRWASATTRGFGREREKKKNQTERKLFALQKRKESSTLSSCGRCFCELAVAQFKLLQSETRLNLDFVCR